MQVRLCQRSLAISVWCDAFRPIVPTDVGDVGLRTNGARASGASNSWVWFVIVRFVLQGWLPHSAATSPAPAYSLFDMPSLVRRSTYARVLGSLRIRTMAMVHRAERSPPRFKRCRTVLPEDACNGRTRAAPNADRRRRPRSDRQTPDTLTTEDSPKIEGWRVRGSALE